MTNWTPGYNLEVLRERSTLMRKVREYFSNQNILEVDTPSISKYPTLDEYIEPIPVQLNQSSHPYYLITSTEYHMKRLLCFGASSIYQICKAFRKEESGNKHNPEFMMIEWYQKGDDEIQLMKDIDLFLQYTISTKPAEFISYRNLFLKFLNLDPLNISIKEFKECCSRFNLLPPALLLCDKHCNNDHLDFLMAFYLEKQIGRDQPTFVFHYPISQAALAKAHPNNKKISLRFELFYKGMELGNGFNELQDYQTHLNRFEQTCINRSKKETLILEKDKRFLSAIKSGLPQCSGVAIGFDRLLMIKTNLEEIDKVMSFSIERS